MITPFVRHLAPLLRWMIEFFYIPYIASIFLQASGILFRLDSG